MKAKLILICIICWVAITHAAVDDIRAEIEKDVDEQQMLLYLSLCKMIYKLKRVKSHNQETETAWNMTEGWTIT
jgi:hypothetical protein